MDGATTTILSGVINASMLSGVFNELVSLLPIVIPVIIGFISVRKGLAFVLSSIRRA